VEDEGKAIQRRSSACYQYPLPASLTNSVPTTHDAFTVAVAVLAPLVVNHDAPPAEVTSIVQSPIPVEADGEAHATDISFPVDTSCSTARMEHPPVETRVRPYASRT